MSRLVQIVLVNVLVFCLVQANPISRGVDEPIVEISTLNSTLFSPSHLCEASEFKYFQAHPVDPAKYIQCDPWGTGVEKSCENGTIWNVWSLKCDIEVNIKNMTFSFPSAKSMQNPEPVNCTLVGMECLNGGVCSPNMLGSYKCECKPEWTGEFCENKVDLTDLSHEILNGTFSLIDYSRKLQEENVTVDMGFYERYKDQLDNSTYTELMKYLSMYKTGEVRYDTLVNNLIEDILEDIYPDAEYLSSFNASAQNVVAMVRLIPSLLSYARYSFERYESVFAQYQRVLNNLVVILNNTSPNMREQAYQYSQLTGIFMNQTMMMVNETMSMAENKTMFAESQSIENLQLTEMDVKTTLRVNFQTTLKATERLFEKLEQFQTAIVEEMSKNPDIYNLTLGEAKCPGAEETLGLFTEIATSSSQIWDSLVNYGFWYLTNIFVQPLRKESMDRFAAVAL